MNYLEKFQALLSMGCGHFNLEIGILAKVDGEQYQILQACSPDDRIANGTVFKLEETYFREVSQQNGPIAIEHAGGSEWSTHPAYLAHKIEVFLGAPVTANGKVYGELCFASLKPYAGRLETDDKEFLSLMAQWVSSELGRQEYIQQLQTHEAVIEQKNKELAEARGQALEASRLKSEFLAMMSHEIHTPINAVLGMTELLQDSPLNPAQREYANVIYDSARVLLALINDILDFSKVDAGKVDLESIPFDPLDVVDSAVELFASKANEKHIRLMSCVDPIIPESVNGDPVRLKQILFSLVSNALKSTETGQVAVSASSEAITENNVWLRFEVQDSGLGLSDETHQHLFQPFIQTEGAITRKYGSAGLDLAIAKRLVELMGGEIGVDSVEGQGATFWFTARLGRIATSPADRAVEEQNSLQGLRAMLIGENDKQRMILNQYLSAWKIKCKEASGAAEGLSVLRQAADKTAPYRLALIDCQVEGMDVLALAREISLDPRLTRVQVIVLANSSQRELAKEMFKLSTVRCVSQPVLRKQLYETLVSAITGRKEISKPSTGTLVTYPPDTSVVHGSVLLAEDNLANQKLAVVQLQKLGYQVKAVSNGREAIEAILAEPNRFQFVLMDCYMPEIDGFTATRLIRKAELSKGKHVPIIAMTANAIQGDREACTAAGMDDYVTKPVNLDALRETLARWVAMSPLSRSYSQPVGLPGNESANGSIDRSVLDGIREIQPENEPDFLTNLINGFFVTSQRNLAHLRAAIDHTDAAALRFAAHSLKGSSANLGAHLLTTYAHEMEDLGSSGALEGSEAIYANIVAEYARVQQALLAECQPTQPKA